MCHMETKRLNLRISGELYEWLKKEAQDNRRSLNSFIVWLLENERLSHD